MRLVLLITRTAFLSMSFMLILLSGQIANAQAQGTTPEITPYEFTESLPAHAVVCYRLVQVDRNGASYDYGIKVLTQFENRPLHVFHNPASNKNSITIQNDLIAPALAIYDMSGRVVMETKRLQLNITSLSQGIYQVVASSNQGEQQTKKLVVN